MVLRKKLLEEVRAFIGTDVIKVFTGVRCCGGRGSLTWHAGVNSWAQAEIRCADEGLKGDGCGAIRSFVKFYVDHW